MQITFTILGISQHLDFETNHESHILVGEFEGERIEIQATEKLLEYVLANRNHSTSPRAKAPVLVEPARHVVQEEPVELDQVDDIDIVETIKELHRRHNEGIPLSEVQHEFLEQYGYGVRDVEETSFSIGTMQSAPEPAAPEISREEAKAAHQQMRARGKAPPTRRVSAKAPTKPTPLPEAPHGSDIFPQG